LNGPSVGFESVYREALGEEVRLLLLGIDLVDLELLGIEVGPEPMEL
jgi:hypothetical protein